MKAEMDMTVPQRLAEMLTLKATAESLVKEYNEATQTASFADAVRIDEKLTEAINEYTHHAREVFYDHLSKFENPLLQGILELRFPTIAKRDRKEGEMKIPVRELIEVSRDIDFVGLHRRCKGVGADKKWYDACQKLNYLHTRQNSLDIGHDEKRFAAEIGDLYRMTEAAKGIDVGGDLSTEEGFAVALKYIVYLMIGEEYVSKVSRADVKFTDKALTRLSSKKVLAIESASHKLFVKVLAYVCHHIVTGESYENLTKEMNKPDKK